MSSQSYLLPSDAVQIRRVEEVERVVAILQERRIHAVEGEPPSTLPLIGQYGIGKTTLAKQVFNHPWVASSFDFRCWIEWPPGHGSSEPYEDYDLPAQLVEWMTEEDCILQDRDAIAGAAKELLSPCSFLFVIDDFGGRKFRPDADYDSEDEYDFEDRGDQLAQLFHVLRAGRAGSTIILIGGHLDGSLPPFVVPPLSPQESWQLFITNAPLSFTLLPADVVDIARMIVRRCEGLPFLILYFDKVLPWKDPTANAWRDVLDKFEDHCSYCPQFGTWITLSFNSLPTQLKKCLLHCAPYPRGHVFNIQQLIDIWVSEDPMLRHFVCDDLRMCSTALTEVLDEWFYPHPVDSSNQKLYSMRIQWHFVLESSNTNWSYGWRAKRSRYAKITPEACWIHHRVEQLCLLVDSKACKFPEPLFQLQFLKKLILIPDEDMLLSADQRCDIKEVPPELCNCTSLIVLDFRSTRIKKLPREFRNLNKLRYLNLSQTDLDSVPESIKAFHDLNYLNLSRTNISVVPNFLGMVTSLVVLDLSHCDKLVEIHSDLSNLVRLERLDLQGCYYLSRLPQEMSRMENLVYVNILECSSLTRMPPDIARLAKLQVLSAYVIGGTHEDSISELKPLKKLKVLALDFLENVLLVQEAKDANLNDKHDLVSLSFQWNTYAENAEQVLESLQPSDGLQNLEIISYPGAKLPQWMTWREPYLKSLLHIKLFNMKACQKLPPLGQLPLLKTAEINGVSAISFIDDAFYGDNGTFPSLEKLILSHMHNLEIWHHTERKDMFPRLCELTLIHCPKFKALCMELKHLQKLSLLMNNRLLYSTTSGIQGVARNIRSISFSLCQELTLSDGCKGLLELGHIEELEIVVSTFTNSCKECIDYQRSLHCARAMESMFDYLQICAFIWQVSIGSFNSLKSLISDISLLGEGFN
uniref:NB-ARC domain-containing protein n=1 Tax=Oryza punctata TaxID=4537 RepID=A0A0E0L699_ORYPU